MKRSILTILSLITFFCCESKVEETCDDCSEPNFIVAIEGKYFQVAFDDNYATVIVEKDSVTNESIVFSPCSNEYLNQVEMGKVLRIGGEIFENCNHQMPLKIKIGEVSIIENCHLPIPEIEGEYTIFNKWFIHSIESPDTIMYIPCESKGAMIEFQNSEPPIMTGITNPNSFFAEVEINKNTITTSEDFTQTLAVGTHAQNYFESMVHSVIGKESEAIYEIENNILKIENPKNSVLIILYHKQFDDE